MRLDHFLITQTALTRSRAQEWIERGFVQVFIKESWQTVTKPSWLVPPDFSRDHLRIQVPPSADWVSRAGEKLFFALKRTRIVVRDKRALDIGTSTGGFVQCLLRQGVMRVVGVDVGQGQLHETLRRDPRLKMLEQYNAKQLAAASSLDGLNPPAFDLITADVSFISIFHLIAGLNRWLKTNGDLLVLFKPQFEVGPEHLNKKGIVKPGFAMSDYLNKAKFRFEELGFKTHSYFASEIAGGDGNQEYFFHLGSDSGI